MRISQELFIILKIQILKIKYESTGKLLIYYSPISLDAIKRCGSDINDLYYLNFKQFKDKNPEILNLQKKIQISRHEFFDNLRINKIEEIKQVKISIQYRKDK